MPVVTILGDEYQTEILSDGNEWILTNLRFPDAGIGTQFPGEIDISYGWFYSNQILNLDLPDGWRIPSLQDYANLFIANGGASAIGDGYRGVIGGVGPAMRSTWWDYWTEYIPPEASNSSGFSAVGAGWLDGETGEYLQARRLYAKFITSTPWDIQPGYIQPDPPLTNAFSVVTIASDSNDITLGTYYERVCDNYPDRFSVRLVRDGQVPPDPPPPPFTGPCAESVEVSYALAIEWGDAIDGTPFAIDDGAQYDAVSSVITLRLLPAELTALEAIYQSSTPVWTIEGSGYLLGPEIDHQDGVDVTITDLVVDGPADAAQTLFDVTVTIHYAGPLPEPTIGSADLVHASGIGYHTTEPLNRVWRTAEGGLDASTYTRESTRRMVWYSDGYSTDQALELINYLRTNRADKTYWPSFGPLFGPGEDDDAYVWIRGWRVLRSSNLTWGFELEVVRDG